MNMFSLLDSKQRFVLCCCLFVGAIATVSEVFALTMIADFFDLMAGADSGRSAISSLITDNVYPIGDKITGAGVAAVIAVFFSCLMRVFGAFFRIRFVWSTQRSLSSKVFKFLRKSKYSKLSSRSRQELVKIYANDTVSYCNGVLENIIKTITDVMTVIGILLMLILYNLKVTITLLVVMFALMALLLFATSWKTFRLGEKKTYYDGQRISLFDEYLSGVKSIRAMKLDSFFVPRIKLAISQFSIAFRDQQLMKHLPRFLIEFLVYMCGLVALLVAYNGGTDSEVIWSSAGVFAFATLRLVPSTMSAYQSWNTIRFNVPAGDTVGEALEFLDSEVADSPIAGPEKESLLFDAATEDSLSVVGNKGELNAIVVKQNASDGQSFVFKIGGMSGIVGASGSGKTTLLDCIAGISCSPAWEIDYQDSNGYRVDQPVSVAYVEQEPPIFQASIIANITLCENPSSIQVEQTLTLLQRFGLTKFCEDASLQLPLDARRLSGGEKLRIGLARAMMQNADLLLLDEPTSGLDHKSEIMVLDLLEDLAKDRVVICVAHRQQNIDRCGQLVKLSG